MNYIIPKNKSIKIALTLLIIFLISFTLFNTHAYASGEEYESVLIKEGEDIEELVEYYKSNYKEVRYIEEIGLISYKEKRNRINSFSTNINESIEYRGTLNEVGVETPSIELPYLASGKFSKNNWFINSITGDHETYGIELGNPEVKVAVIDSGIDVNHPQFKNILNLEKSKSFVEGDNSLLDNIGHGTSVSGIIQAIAPNITIVSYKVMNKTSGDSFWTIEAIIEAVNSDIDILNTSIGTYQSSNEQDNLITIKAFERAVQYTQDNNSIIIASAGNYGIDLDESQSVHGIYHLPGGMEGTLTVGSVGKEGEKSFYSNYGVNVPIYSYGGEPGPNFGENGIIDLRHLLVSTYPNYLERSYLEELDELEEGYAFNYGTSLATPQVTAAVALMKSRNQRLEKEPIPIDQVKDIVLRNAKVKGQMKILDIKSILLDFKIPALESVSIEATGKVAPTEATIFYPDVSLNVTGRDVTGGMYDIAHEDITYKTSPEGQLSISRDGKVTVEEAAKPGKVQVWAEVTNDGKTIKTEKVTIQIVERYDYKNYKTGKLMIHDSSVSVSLDTASNIKNGVVFTGEYAEFHGEGFANITVEIKPKKDVATTIDFKNIKVKEVIIEGSNVEILGDKNVQVITYGKKSKNK